MMTSHIEQGLRAALARRGATVPRSVIERVEDARYRVRTTSYARMTTAVASVAVIAATGTVVALRSGETTTRTPGVGRIGKLHAAPVAYVGRSPRLAVTKLPPGYAPGPDIPVPTLPGVSAAVGQLPAKTFVSNAGDEQSTIIVEEGTDGVGPVPKFLAFAEAHRDVTSEQTIAGQTFTIVDLAAAGVGAGTVVYFPVTSSAWALVGGNAGTTVAQLLTVAESITTARE